MSGCTRTTLGRQYIAAELPLQYHLARLTEDQRRPSEEAVMGKPVGKISKRQREKYAKKTASWPSNLDIFDPPTSRNARRLSASAQRIVGPVQHVLPTAQPSPRPTSSNQQPTSPVAKVTAQPTIGDTMEVEAIVFSVLKEKGCAFLRTPNGGSIFVPLTIVGRNGQPELKELATVRCEVYDQANGRGLRARRIISVVYK